MAFQVEIKLDHLFCHRRGKSSGWRKTAPYMWNIMFTLAHPHVRLNEKFRLQGKADFWYSEGSHGNLETEHMEAGSMASIPEAIGYWKGELQPMEIPYFDYAYPGIVGCISILMEQRNVSNKGAEGGHRALNEYVKSSMNQAINDFRVSTVDVKAIEASITQYIDQEIGKFTDGIEKRVGGAIIKTQSLMQNIWSLIDKDELIGYQIWHFNQDDLREAEGNIPLTARWASHSHGDWEVKGHLKASY